MIDFDNVTLGIRSDLQHQLGRLLNSEVIRGKVAVQRAYADWRRYPQYIVPLSEASIDLIFAPAFGSNKKNATDIRLAIDALELVFTRPEIGTFILLSGDSDFSSLVLKLKEYGKWVIGVGIRESASDLLVQNCNEYFSYNELTGLTKTAEVENRRRDPWELVIEATLRMKDSNDTMRSDRLKQVMQQIDPHFDEKDAGFNRFSKFVLDAGHRGLLVLHKMENGQYGIDIGPDANVPPDAAVAVAAPVVGAAPEPGEQPAPQKRARRRPEAASQRGMTLASAFAVLKTVLIDLEAVGDEAADLDRVRQAMRDSVEDADDPLFEPERFMQMLRQADDAELVELAKNRHGDIVSLLPASLTETEVKPEAKKPAPRSKRKSTKRGKPAKSEPEAPQDHEEQPTEPKPTKQAKKKKTTKSAKSTKTKPAEPPAARDKPVGTRSLRGRGSSRTRGPVGKMATAEPQPDLPSEPRTLASPRPSSDRDQGTRSVRGRGSSRRRGAPATRRDTESPSQTMDRPAASERPTRSADRARQSPKPPTRKRQTTSRSDAMRAWSAEERSADREEPASPPVPPESESGESGGLFKRMTAALQKALGEDKND
ncbi:MAG: NYN domain-containing protein [Gemmatimonadetes bacterium]|nr:NYN domain-containing protein [Gemmatimonadota bacterium]